MEPDLSRMSDEAWELVEAHRYEAANKVFTRLCELRPGDAEAWMMRGVTEAELGGAANAKRFLHHASEIDPAYADPYLHLGKLAFAEGDPNAAAGFANQAVELDSSYSDAWLLAAASHGMRQQHEEAARCARQALEIVPGNEQGLEVLFQALSVLGGQRLLQGQYDIAIKTYQELLAIKPGDPNTLNNLGNAYLALGDYKLAETCYFQAVELSSNIVPEALSNLGQVLQSQGKVAEAVNYYKRALAIEPDNSRFHLLLAMGLQAQGDFTHAIQHCNCALQNDPTLIAALIGKADVLHKQGKYQESYDLLLPSIEGDRAPVNAVLVFADACAHLKQEGRAISLIENLLVKTKPSPRELQVAYQLLGELYDKQGCFDEAFKNIGLANEIKRKQGRFEPARHEQYINKLISFFSPDFLAASATRGNTSELPIFIVGMPRSGTSLVEQILASHPRVHGAGELDRIQQLSVSLAARYGVGQAYPECLSSINHEWLDEGAGEYLQYLRSLNLEADRITDKMPHNYLHLGLIQLLFPCARVIHVMRDPLDTCLSCYFQDFSTSHSYAYDLKMLGEYYLQYEKLMRHWKRVLRLPILPVQYEKLVNEQENVTRELIEFCGLAWDDQVLRFYETKRDVATPSYDQVRQPMYRKSIRRWTNYETHLLPLLDVLDKAN